MSHGARNWPFLTLTARPVSAAATSRSVWRQRKAGICSTSTTSAASAHWSGSCTSVSVGRPRLSRISAKIGSAALRPMPRLPAPEVRLALSNEVLNTRPSFSRAAISFSAAATSSAWARLSSWHGPAITPSGRSAPKRTAPAPAPTSTIGLSAIAAAPRPARERPSFPFVSRPELRTHPSYPVGFGRTHARFQASCTRPRRPELAARASSDPQQNRPWRRTAALICGAKALSSAR